MSITHRSYINDQDKHLMISLSREFPEDNIHVIDMPYRLSSWALDEPDNVRLWFDENDNLIAWAVFQTPFWTIDCACHPLYDSDLHREIISWADDRARAIAGTPYGHPAWYFTVFSEQINRIHDLEEAGFACQSDIGEDSWSKVLMRRSSPAPVKVYEPRPGFTVRPLAGEQEVEKYVDLHQAVFQSKNMTVEWRMRILRQPNYDPDLDIVVEAPDGRLAAFCISWFDGKTRSGHVEPLGSHKDFRPYGLGRVALSEGLRRLQSLGAQNIFVETDNHRNTALRLYELFDFQVLRDIVIYRKDYETQYNEPALS